MIERISPFGFARALVSRWDAAAVIVVIGLIVFLAEASRGLLEPLALLGAAPRHVPSVAVALILQADHAGGVCSRRLRVVARAACRRGACAVARRIRSHCADIIGRGG
jgi:hypothetical protein